MSLLSNIFGNSLSQNRRKSNKTAPVASYLALEQRFLLDAAAATTASEVTLEQMATNQVNGAFASLNDVQLENPEPEPVLSFSAADISTLSDDAPVEVVFIDSAVTDIADLLAGVRSTANVYLLDSNSDGVEQMAEILSQYQNVDAIHILSHGREGEIRLGDTVLDSASIVGEHADALARIGASLTANGDILIYGCDFTGSQTGLEAAALLAESTGADIAASANDTGHADLGGDWALETATGAIEASVAISTEGQAAWQGLLDNQVINAAGGQQTDGSDGLRIHAIANGQLQVEYRGNTQLYHPNLTDDDAILFNGVYVAVGNTVIGPGSDSNFGNPYSGPANGPGISSTDVIFEEANQTVSGSGTSADPTIVTTTLFYNVDGIGAYDPNADVEIVIETIYVEPNPYFTQRVTVTPPSGNTLPIKFYHTLDTFLSGGDNGPAFSLPQDLAQNNITNGDPTLVGVRKDPGGPNDSFVGFAEAQGGRDFDFYYSAVFNGANLYTGGINDGGDIVNTFDANAGTDNGLGIQFTLGAITAPETFEYHIAFGGEAGIDLDGDDSSGATGAGFNTTYTIGSGETIAIADTDAGITNVVGDIQELRVVLTNAQAGDSLTVSLAALPPGVQVQSQTATEIILEAVGTAQEEAVFNTALAALGFTTTSTDLTSRSFEFTVTNELGTEGSASAGAIAINTPPTILDDTAPASPGETVTVNALANDSDAEGLIDPLTLQIAGTANPGESLVVSGEGTWSVNTSTGEITFTPQADFFGVPSPITYTVSDNNGASGSATITLLLDTDGDNVADVDDVDDDNDGILDTLEGFSETIINFLQNESFEVNNGITGGIGSGVFNGNVAFWDLVWGTADFFDGSTNINEIIGGPARTFTASDGQYYAGFHSGDGFSFGETSTTNSAGNREVIIHSLATPLLAGVEYTLEFDVANYDWGIGPGQDLSTGIEFFTIDAGADGDADGDGTPDFIDSDFINANNLYEDGTVVGDIAAGVTGINFEGLITGIGDAAAGFSTVSITFTPTNNVDRILLTPESGRLQYLILDNLRLTNGTIQINTLDSDGDGRANHLDIDSDNDGITDNVEAQTTAGYIAPSGTGAGIVDINNDGLDDNYDIRNGSLTAASSAATSAEALIIPIDTDNDGVDDILDSDSDDDGIDDIAERRDGGPTSNPTFEDADGDGLDDDFEGLDPNDGFDVNDENIVGDNGGVDGDYSNFSLEDSDDDTNADEAVANRVTNDAVALNNDLDFRDNNTPPTAVNDTLSTDEDITLITNILTANGIDSDPDGDSLTIVSATIDLNGDSVQNNLTIGMSTTITDSSGNPIGTITLTSAGLLTFAPAANYTGPVPQITYTVSDGFGHTDTATISLNIRALNDDPDAQDDAFAVSEDGPALSGDVLADNGSGADSDVDDLVLTVSQVNGQAANVGAQITLASGALLTVNSDGTFDYDPNGQFESLGAGDTDTDSFTYQVSDGNGGFDTATVTITINGANDAPVVASNTITVAEESNGTSLGLTAPTDADGDTLTITVTGLPTLGTVTLADGSPVNVNDVLNATQLAGLLYDAPEDYDGVADPGDFTYSVNDGTATVNGSVDIIVTTVNDAPVATDDGPIATAEDMDSTGNVLTNDNDAEGDMLTVQSFVVAGVMGTFNAGETATIMGVGTLTIAANGDFTFTPADNYFGPVPTATYTVIDGNGGSDTADLSFADIANTNDDPDARDDAVAVSEDGPALSGDVLADNGSGADSDVDDAVLTVSQVNGLAANVGTQITLASGALLTVNSDGTFDYDPNGQFDNLGAGDSGTDSFTYQISDGNGGFDTATVTITINGVNDAPVATDDGPVATAEDMDSTGNVLTNDNDAEGDMLTVQSFVVAGVMGTFNAGETATIMGVGTLTIAANGDFTFTPADNYFGPVPTATYTVIDGNGGSDTADLSFADIANTNDDPDARDDAVAVSEDGPALSGDVLADNGSGADSDVDDAVLTVSQVNGLAANVGTQITLASGALLTVNSDGTFDYDPNGQFDNLGAGDSGTDSFTYQISDGNGGFDTATVTITINGVNDAPVATDDGPVATAEDMDSTGNVLTNDNDAEGDMLTVQSFVVAGVMGTFNAGETATIMGVGTLTIAANGDFTFTPADNYFGPVPTATYTVIDGNGGSDTADLSFADIANTNDDPDARDDAVAVSEDGPALSGDVLADNGSGADSDVDDAVLTVSQVNGLAANVGTQITLASGALLTVNSDGTFDYDPNGQFDNLGAGDSGTDSFTYQISDGNGGFDTATVTITINGVNDAPVATDDGPVATAEDMDSTGNVLTNDNDAEGDMLTVQSFVVAGVMGTFNAGETATIMGVGTLTIAANGDFTFTPADNYFGPVPTATYTVIDGNGGSDTADLSFADIANTNDDPDARDDAVAVSEDGPALSGDVLADNGSGADSDVDDAVLTVSQVNGLAANVGTQITLASGALLTVNSDGTFDYDPNGQFDNLGAGDSGTDSFTYQISDGNGGFDTATVTITINGVNDAPVATDDGPIATAEDTPVTGNILTNDNDADGDELTIIAINGVPIVPGGVVVLEDGSEIALNADGTITFTPAPDTNGQVAFSYTASDGEGGQTTASVTINIAPVDDAPRVVQPAPDQIAAEGDDVAIDPSEFITDPDGDPLIFSSDSLPPGLAIDPDTGRITGQPAPGSAIDGPYAVTITAADPAGNVVTISFTFTVNPSGADIETLIEFGEGAFNNSSGRNDAVEVNARADDTPRTITAGGVILDAANNLRSLSGLRAINADGAVLSAVNSAASLQGLTTLGEDRIRDLIQRVHDRFGRAGASGGIDGAEGFSSRTNITGAASNDPTSNVGQFVIDTFIRDRVLYVEAYDTIDTSKSRGFSEFRATLGDGRALPSWMSYSPDGLFLIDRPAHIESLTLKITALRDGGGAITRVVEIDTLTGEIRDKQSASRAYGMSFSNAVEKTAERLINEKKN